MIFDIGTRVYVWDRERDELLRLNGYDVIGTVVGESEHEYGIIFVKADNGITYNCHITECFTNGTGPLAFDGRVA